MIYLATMIKQNNFPSLRELSLISNGIGDNGLMELVYLMKIHYLLQLQTLYLSDNHLHDVSVKQFIAVLKNRCIAPYAEVYIGCNQISAEVIQSMVELLVNSHHPLKTIILEKSEDENW